ncbi:MAG: metal ABC transporter permease [Terrimicrobiaceae bacterium]|nr:metal ABC transporter permease [Terrimicrobiaceae bacterium]
MNWTEIDTWIVITGALISMACAVPGVFLLLNKQSMLGDAISHAVLPGLAIAFLVSGSRDPLPMLAGAVAAGLFTGLLTEWIQRRGRVNADAALGVVFCSLFALGLVLIRLAADRVDLDPGCVLYGAIETAVIDVSPVPRIAWLSACMLIANLLLAAAFYKELRISAFDPALSTSMGIPAKRMQHGLTIVTAVTTVIAFESVGSILVIAMLIVPGATALLLSHRLSVVLGLSLLLAAGSAAAGHLAAISVVPAVLAAWAGVPSLGAVSSAGMMAVFAGLAFFAVLGITHAVRQRAAVRAEPQA